MIEPTGVGRLIAAARHYRYVLGGLAQAQRTGQATPRPADGLRTIRAARSALFEALDIIDEAERVTAPRPGTRR